jgi:hypothetical protein
MKTAPWTGSAEPESGGYRTAGEVVHLEDTKRLRKRKVPLITFYADRSLFLSIT